MTKFKIVCDKCDYKDHADTMEDARVKINAHSVEKHPDLLIALPNVKIMRRMNRDERRQARKDKRGRSDASKFNKPKAGSGPALDQLPSAAGEQHA